MVSSDVHAHVCASWQNVYTNEQIKKTHETTTLWWCDDERQKKLFFPFNCNEGPFWTSGDIIQHCNTAHNSNLGNTHNIIYYCVHVHWLYIQPILMMHNITIGPVEGCSTVTTIHL